MVTSLSEFIHIIKIKNDIYALFNSLWLRVIFIDEKLLPLVVALRNGQSDEEALLALKDNLREEGSELLAQMTEQKFLNPGEDDAKLIEIRNAIENLKISVMYLIATKNCNFACSYCYLSEALCGENLGDMDEDIARQAIDLFAYLIERDTVDNPHIIIYGGEPLLNEKLIEFALNYASRKISNCSFSLNTNGTKVNERIAKLLRDKDVEVSVSIDGPQEIHDKSRVDKGGKGTFLRVIDGYKKLQQHDVKVGISCTITPSNVGSLVEVTKTLIKELNVSSLGFNLLIGSVGDQETMDKYSKDAARALVECFKVTREAGIYEDRMMRRVNSLSNGKVSLNDCAACGSQIVVTPDGMISICQAFMNTGENLFRLGSINNPTDHELWKTWRHRSPFNIPECLKCEVLGICGGGCSYNSLIKHGDIMYPDLVHCAHAKQALYFLLEDLWEITSTENHL